VIVSDLAIRARGLSKRYRLGPRQHYRSLRESISQMASRAAATLSGRLRRSEEEFLWALKDASFEVRHGDVIGIVGRNGAGKSTLLKILSRITEPTEGYVDIKGRAGALLEVGTGFHPELTGRENIFLNAAILGMTSADVRRKFDEIVAFAEIEQFLDTVVKHYSSGMYMRLAFAVAAHLEPDILIVDEVLAVGDTAFQKKCLGKMGAIAEGGRPVIFVSHNLTAVHRLCNRGIVMHQGRIQLDASVDDAIREYTSIGASEIGERLWVTPESAPGDDVVRLVGIRTCNAKGEVAAHFDVHEAFTLDVDYVVTRDGEQLCILVEFADAMGALLMMSFDGYVRGAWGEQTPHRAGRFRSSCHLPADLFSEGDVSVNVRIFSPPRPPNDRPRVQELGVLRFAMDDRMDPDAVRGSFPYRWGTSGSRPALRWSRVDCSPDRDSAALTFRPER
jgi:homopolymeric O-antigen transport system ATP-binding protein